MNADGIPPAFICLGRVRQLRLFSIETNNLIADAPYPTSWNVPRIEGDRELISNKG